MLIAAAVPVAAAAQQSAPAEPLPREEARERNLRAYIELLRRDVRTQKIAVIAEMMQMTDSEQREFWPVYREYERALATLYDERIAAIETYAEQYGRLTAATADSLALKVLDLEARRIALEQTYFTRLKTVLYPIRAARALQIENQIELLVDLQVAASLPVVR